eukprot:COSAG01_NODE_4948_length_4597_cov_3.418853_9_plen_55_part_01
MEAAAEAAAGRHASEAAEAARELEGAQAEASRLRQQLEGAEARAAESEAARGEER